MLPYRDSRLTKAAVGIFFLIVIVYAYFEARGLLFGPSISIPGGESESTSSQYILIQGQVAHIASLSVDGEPIQVTESGAFKEPYVLSPGANRIVFDAKDKYGHTTEKVLEVVYIPGANDSAISGQATTTMTSETTSSTTTTSSVSPNGTTTNVTTSSSTTSHTGSSSSASDVAPGR